MKERGKFIYIERRGRKEGRERGRGRERERGGGREREREREGDTVAVLERNVWGATNERACACAILGNS